MNSTIEMDILKSVCKKLEQAEIPYMLTGSFAVNFYAMPRMTRDIDIVIEIQKAESGKLFQIFHEDFYVDRDSISMAVEQQGMFNIIHNDFVFKIDFIIRKTMAYRNVEFQRRRRIQFNDASIWIVAPEDLILSKLLWAKDSSSRLQLNDIKNLLSSVQNLDMTYIDEWIEKLELKEIFGKLNNE